MWSTIKKTIILTLFLAASIFGIFELYCIKSIDSEILYKTDINPEDELVSTLMNRIQINDELRLAYLNNENIDNDTLIKYIFYGLNPEDFTYQKVNPVKIICNIDGVEFTSETTCSIKIIENDIFYSYQKYYFNRDEEIEFNNFNYQGWTCKNAHNRYYCMYSDYEIPYKGYGAIDSAYVYDNKIVVYEYFLQLSLKESYDELPEIEQIINDGVLYKHTFIRNSEISENETEELNYYLQESKVEIE